MGQRGVIMITGRGVKTETIRKMPVSGSSTKRGCDVKSAASSDLAVAGRVVVRPVPGVVGALRKDALGP
eukprot:2121359-Rhodomonas_salina.3